MYRVAELTAGNLCVCFPEMAGLLRKREKASSSTSNKQYSSAQSRKYPTHRGRANITGGDSYLELKEHDTYGVRIVPIQNHSREQDPGSVQVTDEIIVEEHCA